MSLATTREHEKVAVEPQPPPPSSTPSTNLFLVDLSLRVLLFASTAVAIVLVGTSKQTELIPVALLGGLRIPRTAKFSQSPALIYLLLALCVICFYSILSSLASFSAISKPFPPKKLLLSLALFDAVMVGIMSSALGAASGVAYIGLKGNSHVQWNKICGVYDKFCRHAAGYLAMSLVASVILLFLLAISTYSLYRRSH